MKNLTCWCLSVLLMMSCITRADSIKKSPYSDEKIITSKIVELSDSTGLVYIGAAIAPADVKVYLTQLKRLLGEQQFKLFRSNQIARDQQGFHVTLINPFEYKKLLKALANKSQKVMTGKIITLTLQGLGKVASNTPSQDNAQSYFVIVSSPDGEKFRQQYGLKAKDFHATLGFNPHDIYNMSKGVERLVK